MTDLPGNGRSTISAKALNRYKAIMERIFLSRYTTDATHVEFKREDIVSTADELGIELPKNLGDVVYSVRYRTPLPDSILATQPEGMTWIIDGIARSVYAFRLVKLNLILPRADLATVKIPNATPELISTYALNDEQALLAIVRYNRLIDIFLSITTYSLQNHLRTTLGNGSQIEIDEIYIGIDKYGCHYVIPVQAKGGNDKISVVQTRQDIQCCSEKFPGIKCRAISTQFMSDDRIAIFELTVEDDQVKVVEEKHYRLVPADQLDQGAIRDYRA